MKWKMYKLDLIKAVKASDPERFAKFYNKDYSLSEYSFGCGYVEIYNRVKDSSSTYIELYRDGCYHVRGRIDGSMFWESFDLLTVARQYVKQLKRNNP